MAKLNLSYNELKQQALKRQAEQRSVQNSLDTTASLDDYIVFKPSEELALIEHYENIPGISIEPSIKEVWGKLQNDYNNSNLNIEKSKQSYMNNFGVLQDLEENLDEIIRSDSGVNNFDNQEKEARKELKEAQQKFKSAQYKVDPFKMLLGLAVGITDDVHEIQDAHKGVERAKRNIQAIKERRQDFITRQDKINVKIFMTRQKMQESLEEISKQQLAVASRDVEYASPIHTTLQQQYAIIDKYLAIQELKNSDEYASIRAILSSQNPSLLKDLDNLPPSLPDGFLKISLTNPLTLSSLPINFDRISEIDSTIGKIKSDLPINIDLNNLFNEIDDCSLKENDTIQSIEASMSAITDKSSNEYKKLEMKRNHLQLQENVKKAENEIKKLKEEISQNPPNLQDKLSELKNKQDYLNIILEELDKDSYSTTISSLTQFQTLQNEKEEIEKNGQFRNLNNISNQLDSSANIAQSYFEAFKNRVENKKQREVNQLIEDKYSQNDKTTRDDDDGR